MNPFEELFEGFEDQGWNLDSKTFLIHAVDVEGLCRGIDEELVSKLGQWSPIPTTYAGGAKSLHPLPARAFAKPLTAPRN